MKEKHTSTPTKMYVNHILNYCQKKKKSIESNKWRIVKQINGVLSNIKTGYVDLHHLW